MARPAAWGVGRATRNARDALKQQERAKSDLERQLLLIARRAERYGRRTAFEVEGNGESSPIPETA